MASQRVLLLAIGGPLAEDVWRDILRWSNARTTTAANTWSSDDWPVEIRDEIDAFVECITSSGFTPPILYRSEHVDCWSMGDIFHGALVKAGDKDCQQLYTTNHEVFATWVDSKKKLVPDSTFADETLWLYNRVNEAITAWGNFVDRRLIVLVRSVLGGLWMDEEVAGSIKAVPAWWTEKNK